ncbi:MAG: transketolase-like TK C-terminal-containing protein, partial [Gammaproteobacteria bacterium]
EGLECERWNMLHPQSRPRKSHVQSCLEGRTGPVVAASDYMKAYADQIRAFVPSTYKVLGTDGYGRSDTREKLRWFFEINRHYIAVAALNALSEQSTVPAKRVQQAIKKYKLDPEKRNPVNA